MEDSGLSRGGAVCHFRNNGCCSTCCILLQWVYAEVCIGSVVVFHDKVQLSQVGDACNLMCVFLKTAEWSCVLREGYLAGVVALHGCGLVGQGLFARGRGSVRRVSSRQQALFYVWLGPLSDWACILFCRA